MICPICDAEIYEIGQGNEDWIDTYYYCCSMKPFYHMYKSNYDETVYLVNNGKLVINNNFWNSFLNKMVLVTITYQGKSIEINKIPEFDPKDIENFIKIAVNNMAFL